jgi:lysozyme
MKTSINGINLVKKHEGLKLVSYKDQGGVLTIGYGHTGPDVHQYTVWTQAQADEALAKDLEFAEHAIETLVTSSVNQNQFDALVDFIYNLGAGNFQSSTLLKLINVHQYEAASQQFSHWDYCNHVENKGLLTRRIDEATLFSFH